MNIKNMRQVDLGKTKAFFSVEWPGKLTINDCKLIEGRTGLFAAMPSKKYVDKRTNEDKWQIIVYVEQELLNKISVAAELEYLNLTGKKKASQPIDDPDIPF